MHIVICMWGLLRSLSYTFPSIQEHCLTPIIKAGHTYEIFLHTYNFSGKYQNLRSHEPPVTLNFTEWVILSPSYIYVENQDEFDMMARYKEYETIGDPWKNGFESQKNHIRALHSLNHLANILETQSKTKKIDAVAFLRPDMKYISPLPVILLEKYQNTLFVPDFHRSCLGFEYNDRMAMGDLQSAIIYGKKYQYALEYSKKKLLHSEKFTYDYLKLNQVKVIEIPFRFRRIRADGSIHVRDIELITPHEQYLLSPTGEIPYKLPWFIRIFYGKNVEDHHNMYCSPNPRITHYQVYNLIMTQKQVQKLHRQNNSHVMVSHHHTHRKSYDEDYPRSVSKMQKRARASHLRRDHRTLSNSLYFKKHFMQYLRNYNNVTVNQIAFNESRPLPVTHLNELNQRKRKEKLLRVRYKNETIIEPQS